jgi:hypothetical protein
LYSVLPPPYGGGHDDQHDSRELYQRLDAQVVRIAVHGGQKQQNAPRKERIPQLTGMDISANKRSPLRFHPFLIRYFSVDLPGEGEAEGRMEDPAYKRFGTPRERRAILIITNYINNAEYSKLKFHRYQNGS